ncbi:MAG: LysM peptidoglycan-binding domain-containing protein [Candidatus Marinimicrobia bacterium]|nr:LysM peptidoglycan-binding domain-containing protein [Candidatus Neomarinimicrobiota bacterium]
MKKRLGMYRIVIGLIMVALLVAGCSKEIVEDEAVTEKPTPVQQTQEEPTPEPVVQEPQPEEPEPVMDETVAPVESAVAISESETLEEREGKLEEVLELISETDSVDIFYMVKPGDYLSLIAKNEYGNIGMWRMIYKWNRKKIGDNPNMIYPFHEFLLKKPKNMATDLEFDYYNYTVKSNETLWSIAGKEYKNHYAWIVILRDNANALGSNIDDIPYGTVLKLRTNLFN